MSDDLDKASVLRLAATIDGLRQENAALREENRVLRKQGELREDMHRNALKTNTAAMEAHDKNISAWKRSNDGLVKVVREVIGEERKAVGVITESVKRLDDSVKIATTQKPIDEAEITQRFLRRWFFSDVVPWLVKHGLLLKLIALLGLLGGAFVAAAKWAWHLF